MTHTKATTYAAMAENVKNKTKKTKISKWEREVLGRFGAISSRQCCPAGGIAAYDLNENTDVDLWNTPRVDSSGRKLSELQRYRLHERQFFHALGVHDDGEIARRLGVAPVTFQRVLARVGWPDNFEESPSLTGGSS